jgi:hypothetical protein
LKPEPSFAGAGGLDGRVDGQQIGLARNVGDQRGQGRELLDLRHQRGDQLLMAALRGREVVLVLLQTFEGAGLRHGLLLRVVGQVARLRHRGVQLGLQGVAAHVHIVEPLHHLQHGAGTGGLGCPHMALQDGKALLHGGQLVLNVRGQWCLTSPGRRPDLQPAQQPAPLSGR